MPRAKKQIKIQVHTPLLECKGIFQERVNEAYRNIIAYQLKKMDAGKKRKGEVLKILIKSI